MNLQDTFRFLLEQPLLALAVAAIFTVTLGGMIKRVALARALLYAPDWLFLDEATAALDEENQDAMMELLREELPDTAVVSIGHRPGLDRHHDRVLVLEPSPEGAVLTAREEAGGGGGAGAPTGDDGPGQETGEVGVLRRPAADLIAALRRGLRAEAGGHGRA